MSVEVKYHTTATASGGGRDGKAELMDGTLSLQLAVPKEFGGPGGNEANPEKLFALGYSACFLSSLRFYASQAKFKIPDESAVSATIGIGPRSQGGFGIAAELSVFLPGIREEDAKKLVEGAHEMCPYSNAMNGNVEIKTTVRS